MLHSLVNGQIRNQTYELTSPLYRPDIDGLRAIAVLAVVAFHGLGVRGGFIGVDIFFVISGFLISSIIFNNLKNENFRFSTFYARRIKRIFPALIIVLFSCLILGWFLLLPTEYKQLGKHVAGASVFISNFLLWNESGYFDADGNTKPLLHLWSLGIEEQFYIIWPLLIWITWKTRFNLIYLIALGAIISFLFNLTTIHSNTIATFYSPHTRFWELLCGSFFAYLTFISRKTSQTQASLSHNLLSLLGFIIILYGLCTLDKQFSFPGGWALIPTLGAALIIAAGTNAWVNRVILSNRVLVWFGLISYPLYLWHWPLLVFSTMSTNNETAFHHLAKALAILISILLAWLTYKLIEKPIRFGKRGNTKIMIVILFMSIVAFLGYKTYLKNGLDFRVPKILQEITQGKYIYPYYLNTCMINLGDDPVLADCGLTKDKNKKTIFIWGDSHASHLFPGYKEKFGKDFNLTLRAFGGCAPIIDKEKAKVNQCYAVNEKILEMIKKEKPDKIVLSAVWIAHSDWRNLSETISQLKSIGIKDIDLIGPDPWWVNGLPRELFLHYRRDKLHRIPERMTSGLRTYFLKLDPLISEFAYKENINYISPAQILCNSEGCLTQISKENALVSLDRGHLTEYGSVFMVSHFPNYS